jgi:ABC-type transport system involved in multi-copper enzyme maturation permease subunit
MVTFTLEPSRVRVIAAKFVSILLISVLALVIGVLLGALANVLYGAFSGHTVVWDNPVKFGFYYLLLYVFGMATGFAFGALFLNSPAGIVIYFVYSFVLPTVFGIAAALMNWFESLQPWIDFNFSQSGLIDGTIAGNEWAKLAVSGLLWLVLPLAIGIWRIRRAEVK